MKSIGNTTYDESEGEELIQKQRSLNVELVAQAKAHKKLLQVKGGTELLSKLEEILYEIEQMNESLMLTIKTSKSVFYNLKNLYTTMIDLKAYFIALEKKSIMLSKSKIKQQILQYYLHLRTKGTQLETSVTLEVVTRGQLSSSNLPRENSELYNLGISYYYGLGGNPKNHIIAMENFTEAAKEGKESIVSL
jgi:hypothetical protein